jgi:uncharacterized protein YqjF (DUF2071 family)
MPEPSLDERLRLRQRPPGWPAGYQEWRRLLFVHWPVPPWALRRLVPPPLSLDLHDGAAYVSLTPFIVQAARPIATPRRLGLSFLETNVRTYVHLEGREPGVYFFSLDAASAIAVLGARLGLGLPYFLARGRLRGSDYRIRRLGKARATCHAVYTPGPPIGYAQPGSLDFFLIERYVLHVRRGPSLWRVRVHHPPYPLYRAQLETLADQLVAAAGVITHGPPPLVHFASGVDVAISPPRIRLLG